MPFEAGQRVTLRSFRGATQSPADADPRHDYWRLVGQHGEIVDADDTSIGRLAEGPRVLVQFDNDPAALGLHSHNPVPRALWILTSDLVLMA